MIAPGHVLHGVENIGVGAAAADVAAHAFTDFLRRHLHGRVQIRGHMAGHTSLDFLQGGLGGTDLPRRAVTALVAVVLDEGRLHGVEIVRRAQAFHGGDLVTLVHHRQGQAGVHPPAVHHHGAGAALAVVAAFLGAGELQLFAQGIEQGQPGVGGKTAGRAVDGKRHLGGGRLVAGAGGRRRAAVAITAEGQPGRPRRPRRQRRRSSGRGG